MKAKSSLLFFVAALLFRCDFLSAQVVGGFGAAEAQAAIGGGKYRSEPRDTSVPEIKIAKPKLPGDEMVSAIIQNSGKYRSMASNYYANLSNAARRTKNDTDAKRCQEISRLIQAGKFPAFPQLQGAVFKIGDNGFFSTNVHVIQVIAPDSILAGNPNSPFMLRGISTANLIDGQSAFIPFAIGFTGNTTFVTAVGTEKTVPLADPLDLDAISKVMTEKKSQTR